MKKEGQARETVSCKSIQNGQDQLQPWIPGMYCVFCRKPIKKDQKFGKLNVFLDSAFHLQCERQYIEKRLRIALKSADIMRDLRQLINSEVTP